MEYHTSANSDQPIAAQEAEQASTFNIREYIYRCLRRWPWFLLSMIIFGALGVLFVLKQQPTYERTMSLLIKEEGSGTSGADISNAFASMGLVSTNTNAYNEMVVFASPYIMNEVIQRLDLRMNYIMPGKLRPKTLYGADLPIEVLMPDITTDQGASFKIVLHPDGTATVSEFMKFAGGEKYEYPKVMNIRTGFDTHRTPIGRLVVRPNANFQGHLTEDTEIIVSRSSAQGALDAYTAKVKVGMHDKDSDVIDLTMTDVSTARAEAVLNNILDVYNENWIEDKNIVAKATTNFIQGRLDIIERDLGNVDSDISTYKSNNMVPDIEKATDVYLNQAVSSDQALLDLTSRLAMAKYVRDYLNNPANRDKVIPANTGIGDMNLEQQIRTYNLTLLDRENLLTSATAANPVVQEYDTTLRGLRESIIKAVGSLIVSLSTSIANTEQSLNESKGIVSSAPKQARDLLSVERQQKVKEALYMFLLQKLEENELTQAFTAYNTRLVTPPMGPAAPVSPKKTAIIGIMLLLGLALPALLILAQMNFDTKVNSKKDLEGCSFPYIGEVPLDENVTSRKKFRRTLRQRRLNIGRKNKPADDKIQLVVAEGNRSVVNEAYRVARNNIDFMASKEGVSPVYLLTSFNAGSGKSFTSVNLGAAFALKNKRVLLIDGDMRHASLSSIVGRPSRGLSSYLKGDVDDWENVVCHVPGHNGLDILPVGVVPPNPAELLESPRLERLLREARDDYDYVFIDCPPYNVVVDTSIFNRYADRTIFIVRAGLFDKTDLPELQALYDEKKLANLCVLLNGTSSDSGSYYGKKSYYYDYYSDKK